MLVALVYGASLVLGLAVMMGGAALIVRTIEHGKISRTSEIEKTRRAAFEAAYVAAQNRQLELMGGSTGGTLPAPDPKEVEWNLPS